jgi:hypothetical protein
MINLAKQSITIHRARDCPRVESEWIGKGRKSKATPFDPRAALAQVKQGRKARKLWSL